MSALLETAGLSIGYGHAKKARVVASDITLALDGGRLVSLVGPNGAGKSTLLRTLARLQAPLAGSVSIEGVPVESMDRTERARKIGVAFTDPVAADYHTVFDIAAFGRYPYTDARNSLSREDRDHVVAALASLGLEAMASRPFSELSDGERQKTVIARALAQTTPLVLLDEPTAYLDATSRIELMSTLGSVARDRKALVVVSTHDIDLALRVSDEVLLFSGGAVAHGRPEDLALSGFVARSFDTERARFDAASGRFVATERAARPGAELRVRAADPASLAWTLAALRREGFAAEAEEGADESASPIARLVVVERDDGGYRWRAPDGSSHDSIAELLAWARALPS